MAAPEEATAHEQTNPFVLDSLANKRYMALFDVERWQPALAELTASTTELPISREEAVALMDRYRRHWGVGTPTLTIDEQTQTLNPLVARIEQQLIGRSAFARLSTRSPKDAGQDPNGHPQAVSNCIEELRHVGGADSAPGEWMKAGLRSCGTIMRVSTGEEVVLLLSSSERTYTDLCRTVDDSEVEWSMGIILRDWIDMNIGDEYRCVVCDGAITAIFQYNDLCHYTHVCSRIHSVAEAVVNWFNTSVAPRCCI